jgi:hypothetical protein
MDHPPTSKNPKPKSFREHVVRSLIVRDGVIAKQNREIARLVAIVKKSTCKYCYTAMESWHIHKENKCCQCDYIMCESCKYAHRTIVYFSRVEETTDGGINRDYKAYCADCVEDFWCNTCNTTGPEYYKCTICKALNCEDCANRCLKCEDIICQTCVCPCK